MAHGNNRGRVKRMNGLTKEVTATCGNITLVVGLSNKDEVMYVKSTIRVKPKNRKQKKECKKQKN